MRHLAQGARGATASPEALGRVAAARAVLEHALACGQLIYGTTTGVGARKTMVVDAAQRRSFEQGLIRAHCFAIGDPLPMEVVRLAIAIRVNSALCGHTGCSTGVIEALLALLARGVVPLVPRQGSVGCADLGQMAAIAAVLVGEGEAWYEGERLPSQEALRRAGLAPFVPAPRDALALVATNAFAVAAAAIVLRRAAAAFRLALVAGLAAAAALGAMIAPWHTAASLGSLSEAAVARWLLDTSAMAPWPERTVLHDPLSLRCLPQIFGAVASALVTAAEVVCAWSAKPDDNPSVVGEAVVTSGASLPLDLALAVQNAALALAHLARSSCNRSGLLANGWSGLPVGLADPAAPSTGMGPAMKLAGELLARGLRAAMPVSPIPLVLAGGMEDEASFLPLAVDGLAEAAMALARLATLEATFADRAFAFVPAPSGGPISVLRAKIASRLPFALDDQVLGDGLSALAEELLADSGLADIVAAAPFEPVDGMFGFTAL